MVPSESGYEENGVEVSISAWGALCVGRYIAEKGFTVRKQREANCAGLPQPCGVLH
jgi:hypothetical protein